MASSLEESLDTSLAETSETPLDTSQTSLSTSQSSERGTVVDDDEDEELLALRIAALESIRLKKEEDKQPEPKLEPRGEETADRRPNFVITGHPRRTNLVSIVTNEFEIEQTIGAPVKQQSPPPPLKIDSPPPSPIVYRYPPPPYRPIYRARSRSFERRRSFSPRRWSPPRRRSPGRRTPPLRRSPHRLSPRRSPLRGSPTRLSPRRSPLRGSPPRRSPLGRSPFPVKKSPQRRSPRVRSPNRRSPLRRDARAPELSASEWETDSDPPTEDEGETNKENRETVSNGAKPEDNKEANVDKTGDSSVHKSNMSTNSMKKDESTDHSQDDVLKLDATAEMDEFSKFLNEFESEVLATDDKVEQQQAPPKKQRLQTERRTVDGKKQRKKVKAMKDINGRERTPSLSPEGGRWRRRKSPVRNSPSRRSPNRRANRQSPLRKSERSSRPKDEKDRTTGEVEGAVKRESRDEREEKERRDYEERLAKLSTPERERLEARRKKFESKREIKPCEPKRISLRTESGDQNGSLRRDLNRLDSEEGLSLDISDTMDMFEDQGGERRKRAREMSSSPPRKAQVTDLRVQLHKKKQAKQAEEPSAQGFMKRRESSPRRPPAQRRKSMDGGDSPLGLELGMEEEEPVQPFKGRIIVPPVQSKKKKEKKRSTADEVGSEESPSPPSRDRLILVRQASRSPDIPAPTPKTLKTTPKKSTLKESLHLRLGEKMETPQFTEEEILEEMLRQKMKKMKKKMKKEKKEKKDKKKKKSDKSEKKVKKVENVLESGEELNEEEGSEQDLFDFFEKELGPLTGNKQEARKRTRSGGSSRSRKSSEDLAAYCTEESSLRGRLGNRLGERLGDKVNGDGDSGEIWRKSGAFKHSPEKERKSSKILTDLDMSIEGEDILEKMKRRNEKRMKRLKEIEKDKLMFA